MSRVERTTALRFVVAAIVGVAAVAVLAAGALFAARAVSDGERGSSGRGVEASASNDGGTGGGDDRPADQDGASDEPKGTFVPSLDTSRAVLWAVGDGADGGEDAKALARRISAGPIDRLLYLGDVYENGTRADFEKNYDPVYGHLARITAPTPGNHDWPNHAEGYDPYWEAIRGRAPPPFYAFRVAGWKLLSLNSETALERDGAQVQWLRRELRGGGTCRLAFWHRARYSAGEHGDADETAPLWDELRGRAAIVVSGHDHDMQRLEPRDGITAFVSGAGGRSHYAIDRSDPRLAFANDTDWGALRLELEPGLARFAFVTTEGRTLDSGEVGCDP